MQTPTMLTIKEAAEKSGLANHYLRQLCLQHKIVYVNCGKKYLLNYEKLIEYLNTGDSTKDTVEAEGIRRIDERGAI